MQVTWQPVKVCAFLESGKEYRLTPTWETYYIYMCDQDVLSKPLFNDIQGMKCSLMSVFFEGNI